jgi:hypothetical protein
MVTEVIPKHETEAKTEAMDMTKRVSPICSLVRKNGCI